jgi:RNA polymerase sigma factor (sigma-70 family)
MAAREKSSSFDATSGDGRDRQDHCAPIRQTLAGELDGLFRFAAARLGHNNTHMAEDVVQQAVLIAMAHASPPSEADSQRAWLRGIVHNVIRSQRRSLRRGREAINRAAHAGLADYSGSSGPAHSSAPSRQSAVQALYLAVTDLNQAEQDLFYAFYRAGRSHACIAAELGTTCKGVEARLYRLRSRLRSALERSGEPLS